MDDFQKANPFRHKSGKYKMAVGQTLTMNDLPDERLKRYRELLAQRHAMKEADYNATLDKYLAEDNDFLKMWNGKKKKYEKENPTVMGVHVDSMMGNKKKKPKPVFAESMYKTEKADVEIEKINPHHGEGGRFASRSGGGGGADKSGIKTSKASPAMAAKIQSGVGGDRQVKSVVEVKVDGKLVGHVSREQHFTTTDGGAKRSDGHRYHARDAQGKGLGAYRSNYRDGGYVQEQRTFSTAKEAVMAVATGNTP